MTPQSCQACRCSQFPGDRLLSAGAIEGSRKVILDVRHDGYVRFGQQFCFDAQQLGETPAVLVALGPAKGLFYGTEPLLNSPSTTPSVCQLAEEPGEPGLEIGLWRLIERGAEKSQSTVEISLPYLQGSVKPVAPTSPNRQRMCSRASKQHCYIALGCSKVADEQGDGAGRLGQRETKGNRLMQSPRLVDGASRGSPGLIGKSLEP